MKKIISALLVSAVMVTALTSCSSSSSNSGTSQNNTSGQSSTSDKSLQEIKDKGKIVIGLDDSFPPMGFRDEKNEIVGFDIDVANEVATRLGVKIVFQPIIWANNISEIDSKSIDVIWNGMSINETRKQKLNLTEPYLNNQMIVVVPENSTYKTIADLAGKKIGVQNGSLAQEILLANDLGKNASKVITFEENRTGFNDLEAGGIDALFIDQVFADYYIAKNKKPLKILENSALADDLYVVGFRKGDQALRDEVQKILSEMKKDGKLADISNKWFGSDITVVK